MEQVSAGDYHVNVGIDYHEKNCLPQSTNQFHLAANAGHPTGCLLYGLALRHGWGCRANSQLSLTYLRQAAETKPTPINVCSVSAAGGGLSNAELALAVYELGVSYKNGWGVESDKKLAVKYFEMAALWGDADACIEAGDVFLHGVGTKKDKKKAASYYRLAEAKGKKEVGLSWIWKEKYN